MFLMSVPGLQNSWYLPVEENMMMATCASQSTVSSRAFFMIPVRRLE
uniref:Uncharacterized protein n=1 Tax=Arundo donax TaxID=35708 RepID=A0A0A8YXM3_ARUDO